MRKSIFITGSGRGIGRAAALEFARTGYNVAINCSRDEAALHDLCGEITRMGADCLECFGDVADPDFIEKSFARIKERFGGIDVLVNNAGISYIGLLQDMQPFEWDRLIGTNLTGVYNTCRSAIPLMLHNKSGKIINISSVWGSTGASCETAYSATKGALNSLTKALAKELAPSNIQVNALACGAINTQMNDFLDEAEMAALLEEIPSGRMGEASEAAEMIRLLAEAPAYLTGQVIAFDGGWQ